jgi:hypothetical protein
MSLALPFITDSCCIRSVADFRGENGAAGKGYSTVQCNMLLPHLKCSFTLLLPSLPFDCICAATDIRGENGAAGKGASNGRVDATHEQGRCGSRGAKYQEEPSREVWEHIIGCFGKRGANS